MIYKLFLLFCFYLPFQIALNPVEGTDLASGRILIILLFVLWLINGLKNKKLFIPFKIQTLLVLSFLFISAFSLFWAENLDWGVRKLLFLLSIFPVYFLATGIIQCRSREGGNSETNGVDSGLVAEMTYPNVKIVKFLVWGAGIAGAIGIIQFLLQFIIGLDQTAYIWRTYITPIFLGESFTQAVLEYPSWLVNIGRHNYLRAFATFPDPHMFSFYLGMALPLAATLFFYEESKCHSDFDAESRPRPREDGELLDSRLRGNDIQRGNDKIYLLLFFIILIADLLTFSRGGYVGLAAGLIFIILYFAISKKVSVKKLSASFVLVLILLVSLAFTPVGKRFYASFSASEGSNKIRFENWAQAVDVIKNNPLGVGIGNYSYAIEPSADYRKPIYAHNLYLDIAAETGIINAVIFAVLILTSIISLARRFAPSSPRQLAGRGSWFELGAAASLVIFSAHSIFDTALYSVQVLPLFLIIIVLNTAE